MYQGSPQLVPPFFAQCGHPVPVNYNPADWMMNVAQVLSETDLASAGFFAEDTRGMETAFHEGIEGKDALGITITGHAKEPGFDMRPVGIFTEIKLLFDRETKNLVRDTNAVAARFGLTIFLSTLIGVIFLNVGETNSAEQSVRFPHPRWPPMYVDTRLTELTISSCFPNNRTSIVISVLSLWYC